MKISPLFLFITLNLVRIFLLDLFTPNLLVNFSTNYIQWVINLLEKIVNNFMSSPFMECTNVIENPSSSSIAHNLRNNLFPLFQTGLGYARGEMSFTLDLDLVIIPLNSVFSKNKHASQVETISGVESPVRDYFSYFLLGIRKLSQKLRT